MVHNTYKGKWHFALLLNKYHLLQMNPCDALSHAHRAVDKRWAVDDQCDELAVDRRNESETNRVQWSSNPPTWTELNCSSVAVNRPPPTTPQFVTLSVHRRLTSWQHVATIIHAVTSEHCTPKFRTCTPCTPPSQRCGLCQNFKQTTLTTRSYKVRTNLYPPTYENVPTRLQSTCRGESFQVPSLGQSSLGMYPYFGGTRISWKKCLPPCQKQARSVQKFR